MAEEFDEFGEFEDEQEEQQDEMQQGQSFEQVRVRMPRGKEVLGVIEQRLGASRMTVKCFDGKARNCRVPGRLRRKLWLREGDIVLVEPWEFQPDEKGDVIFKYSKSAIEWLKKKGYVKIEEEF